MFQLLTMIAVACYAISGALKAMQKEMDFFGAVVIALVTAVGGGTVRDLLLSRPIFWVHDPIFLHVGGATATLVVLATRVARAPSQSVRITDAVGLSLFAVIGAHTAYEAGVPAVTGILTGAMTGFVGGIVRDVLCGEIPRVLKQDIHATAALTGASLYMALRRAGLDDREGAALAMAGVFAIRVIEMRWGVHLPTLRVRRPEATGRARRAPAGRRPLPGEASDE